MFWRGGRAVECTGLENQQGLTALRGFESHPLRHLLGFHNLSENLPRPCAGLLIYWLYSKSGRLRPPATTWRENSESEISTRNQPAPENERRLAVELRINRISRYVVQTKRIQADRHFPHKRGNPRDRVGCVDRHLVTRGPRMGDVKLSPVWRQNDVVGYGKGRV